MGGTLKSAMCCGCEFWEILNHVGEMVPDFSPCKKHTGIRERQLEEERDAFKLLYQMNNKPVDATQEEIIAAHQIVQAHFKAGGEES